AGGGAVGVAGSVAIEIENIQTIASLGGRLTAGGGDVSIQASSDSTTSASALPADSTGGAASVGVGASVVVVLVDDTTTAELIGTLIGGHDLTIAAATTHLGTAHAKTGAAGGKVAVVPSVAIFISNITTLATVGAGTALSIAGAFRASADQNASANTTAEGSAKSAGAAIGVSVALTIANHRTAAVLERNLSADGAVTLAVNGKSESSATAKASAAGAPGESTSSASSGGVDGQVGSERGFAAGKASATGGQGSGSKATPKTETSDKNGSDNKPVQVAG